MPIGTAHIARLCLPNSELHVGVEFGASRELERALTDPERPAVLLFPGDDAIGVLTDPPAGPVTLVVVDGTWSQAKKMVRSNPVLARLPRYAFRAPAPSEYRIRREPDEAFVSTIEAIVYALGVLEGDPERLRGLLAPFRAMVDRQIELATLLRSARVRHAKRPRPPRRPGISAVLAERRADLVCISGEANAWPYRSPELRTAHRDELVHWVAHRPATGEVLDVVVRPRGPLSPSTPAQVGLTREAILGGVALPELLEAWRGFVRDGDLVCSWGHYAPRIFRAEGGELPGTRIELRGVARAQLRDRVGTMDALLARLGSDPASLDRIGRGRAGLRAAQTLRIATLLGEGALVPAS
jgi:DTW domain-containing protein YfiP